MQAQRRLAGSSVELVRIFERLSSGQRITRASDDPAGLALLTILNNDTRIYTQAIRNVNDGISLLEIAESSVQALSEITTRIKELATQAASGTYSTPQRSALDNEAQALASEYNRIIATTHYNNLTLLNGDASQLSIQAGQGINSVISLSIGSSLSQLIGNGSFSAATSYSVGIRADMMQSADLNGDGNADIVVGVQTDDLTILLGNGDGSFKATIVQSNSTGNKGATSELTLGDVNGDGIFDLITHNSYDSTVSVLLGNGNGTFKVQTSYTVGALPTKSTLGDVNEDGVLDLLIGTTTTPVLLLGNANGTYKAPTAITMGSSSRYANLADVNGDNNLDIVSPDATGGIFIRLGNGNGTFAVAVSYNTTHSSDAGTIGDVNGDGNVDIVNIMPSGSSVGVFLGNGDGTFRAGITSAAPGLITAIRASLNDLNNDGHLDLTYNDRDSDSLVVQLGNGDGTFKAYTTYATTSAGPRSMVVVDVNGDEVLDLVSGGNADATINVLFGNASNGYNFPTIDLSTISGAQDALTEMDLRLDLINRELGNIGAQQSRLEITARTLLGQQIETAHAASRIADIDIAEEVAKMVRLQILQQASIAMQGHALEDTRALIELLL